MELPKSFEPASIEAHWYPLWESNGYFRAGLDGGNPNRYCILLPPPNVTGTLHMGHAFQHTLMDALTRYHRMMGWNTLWQPGTDHAGIATQTVVEKTLKKQGTIKHREDLGRDRFLERVWEWKERHGGIIIQQLKKLGASCDWSRERFTMDPAYSRCVQKVFVELYRKGLIYRGKRMVNWCPVSLTALSDEEVVMKEQQGTLFYFQVDLADEPGTRLTIATTRPETIPADTAIAVNPQDPRYARFIGKRAVRPLPPELPREERLISIVGDDKVDFEFGTGVLKVTPAHDRADFEIGQRHGLLIIDVLNPDGTMNARAGEALVGLDRFKARQVAADQLKALGLLPKEEPYKNNVGFSERAEVPIEPRLSEQWFLRYPSVASARGCVADGRLRFYPERWAKVYDHWMSNIQDWCISRQLWWGHRIPVWYRRGGSAIHCDVEPPPDPENWVQDPDVLDTWFSSWLWPFATLGWPERTDALARFYPTTDLVTGPDIIFFWVARMIMAGYEFMGEMPFRNVYFTGIIRDKQGRKMSKSLGNSPDPLDLIGRYGADALRFGVMRSAPLGQDILFDEQNVELGRNFCNKLWNACRFRQMQAGAVQAEIDPALLTSDDKWILWRLDAAVREIRTAFEAYRFTEVTQTLYRFFWSEYCDWYIEASKAALSGADTARKANALAVIDFVLSHALRLFHPFLPFITEELWHGLGYQDEMPENQGGASIMFAPWPKPLDDDFKDRYRLAESDERAVEARNSVVTVGRNLRREFNLPTNKRVRFLLRPSAELAAHDRQVIQLLLNAEELSVDPHLRPQKGTPMAVTPLGELYLPLEGLIDLGAERARLRKELAKIAAEIEKAQAKLGNSDFVAKVPPNVLEEHRRRLAEWEGKHRQVRSALEALGD
jgi:valyl-tRNA synthetase